jgi:hypothetical protein
MQVAGLQAKSRQERLARAAWKKLLESHPDKLARKLAGEPDYLGIRVDEVEAGEDGSIRLKATGELVSEEFIGGLPRYRVIAEYFMGPMPRGWHTHHINGNHDDNRIVNMVYIPGPLHIAITRKIEADPETVDKLSKSDLEKLAIHWNPGEPLLDHPCLDSP